MLCDNCGNDMPLGQRTCPHCGVADLVPVAQGPTTFTIVEQTEVKVPQPELWSGAPTTLTGPAPLDGVTSDNADPAPVVGTGPLAGLAPLAGATSVAGSTNLGSTNVGGAGRRHEAPADVARTASRSLTVVALVGGLAAIVGSFTVISSIESDAPIPQFLGDYGLDDLGGGTNMRVAVLLAGALMLVGVVMIHRDQSGMGARFGAGLVGGAGLALGPVVAFAWASVDALTDRALVQAESVSRAGGGGQVFESTLGVGFFLVLIAGAMGIVAFVMSLRQGVREHDSVSRWLCVATAIACLVAGAGQLLPERSARLADNFSNSFNSWPHVYSRLAMIAVFVIGGTLGILLASRFGLGLAIGAASVYVWQWISSVLEVGNYPAPPALGNPGNISAKPHVVTNTGIIVMVLLTCVVTLVSLRADRSRTSG